MNIKIMFAVQVGSVRADKPWVTSQPTPWFEQQNGNRESGSLEHGPAPFLDPHPTAHNSKAEDLSFHGCLRAAGWIPLSHEESCTQHSSTRGGLFTRQMCRGVASFSKWESSWLRPQQTSTEAREAGAGEAGPEQRLAHLPRNALTPLLLGFTGRKHLLSEWDNGEQSPGRAVVYYISHCVLFQRMT